MSRPALSTRTTVLSDTSGATSLFSSGYKSANTTAMTSPDLDPLLSPKKAWLNGAGKMDQMLTVMEADESSRPISMALTMAATENHGSRRPSASIGRGPSVKDRASAWENTAQAGPSTSTTPTSTTSPRTKRSLPQPRSESGTAPLRINKRPSPAPTTVTPAPARRIPIPATAPVARTGVFYQEPEAMPSLSVKRSPDLKRGKGSAKKMIQQWENLPPDGSPTRRRPTTGPALSPTKRLYSQDYLDNKPLPVPSATPLPTSNYYSPSKPYTPLHPISTPTRAHKPSPLQHLQTPSHTSAYRSTSPTSPSQYSLSTSPSSGKMKGKSPLKDMLNLFGGGIRDVGRKMKGKKEKFGRSRESLGGGSKDDLHFWEEPRVGTSGLPGGIVFNDRMGDREMEAKADEAPVIRSSSVIYLIPTPCSSVSPWGSWLTSFATLSSTHLRITYCPIFQTASGNSTPRRVFSGSNPLASSTPSVPFGAIPLPAPGQEPDVELSMKDCIEIRSLRRDEVKGRGIPPAPEGIGTEVLEMVWNDGGKRYFGVEGVGGRLGWVSAIWDVLLACQSSQPSNLPPPSPNASTIKLNTQRKLPQPISPLGSFSHPAPPPELAAFRNRIASLEREHSSTPPPETSAPPVQKVGDTWVAASVLAPNDTGPGQGMERVPSAENLRDSVQRMFDQPPQPLQIRDEPLPLPMERQSSDPMERVKAWQQPDPTTQHLSIFRLARGTIPPTEIGEPSRRTETVLSFDPNDLNPSRSASQVRRQSTILGGMENRKVYEPRSRGLSGVEEVSDNMSLKDPTHISHITFPKPTLAGQKLGYNPLPLSPHIEQSDENGSVNDETRSTTSGADSAHLFTPLTTNSSATLQSSVDQTVLAKLEDHTTDHGKLETQINGVQGDLQRVIGTLTSLVAGAGLERTSAKGMEGRLHSVAMDVKAIENALNLNTLATKGLPSLEGQEEAMDGKVPEVHKKLDAIAKLCEELLARPSTSGVAVGEPVGMSAGTVGSVRGAQKASTPPASVAMAKKGSLGISVDATEAKEAGEEVAAIMMDLTGGSCKASPRVGGIQVLHSVTNPSSPVESAAEKLPGPHTMDELPGDTRQQVGEVLSLVKELKDARALQTQQTTDIARYLSELNSWLEKFVVNSTKELSGLNTRLTSLVGPEDAHAEGADPAAPHPPIGLPDLVADMHAMVSEQKRRAEAEGMVGQRLDTLLQMMGAEQERHAGQQNTVEQVMGLMDRQRQDNEMLLRALATDLTSEIRGERIRFVEAMQQATSVNVHLHVEEFKKLLGTEVAKSMQELGQMREEKKALEQNISDLFALKAKHGMSSRSNTKKGKGSSVAPSSPAFGVGRGLPAPPAGRPQ